MKPGVVVLGASSGIGAAAARRFLTAGWRVALLARRRDQLAAVGASAEDALIVAVDASDPASLTAAAAQVRAAWSQVDAVVCSAGDFLVAPMELTTDHAFEHMWRLTVTAKFQLVRDLLPALLRADAAAPRRAVVHIASLAAHRDFADETAYTSAMHGVLGLARAQDVELRARGIRVAALSPGLVRTPLTERSFPAAALAGALPPEAIATTIFRLVDDIRAGSYIGHLLQEPA